MAEKKGKTRWHRLLGTLLEYLLTPVGVSVQCDIKVMSEPPEADILLLRRKTAKWTAEQKARLPDGIRDTAASHVLLEFKYTESVNLSALKQTLCYDFLYKRANHLDRQVQSFLVSAKTPRAATLEKYDYRLTEHSGIYQSCNPLLEEIKLMVLNDLADTQHNAWVKCFASHKQEKRKAFELLKTVGLKLKTIKLEWLLSGLWKCWFIEAEEKIMKFEVTPEDVVEMGKVFGDAYLSALDPEQRLKGLAPEERMEGLAAQDRVEGLAIDERLVGLSIEEIEAWLKKIKT